MWFSLPDHCQRKLVGILSEDIRRSLFSSCFSGPEILLLSTCPVAFEIEGLGNVGRGFNCGLLVLPVKWDVENGQKAT